MQPGETRPRERRVAAVLLLATAAFLLARLPLLPRRVFDPDEFEHAHAAWCFFRGMLPYRDFFEHHTPWYYYVLRPFFNWFAVDTSFDSAVHYLVLGRVLSLVLTVVSLGLVVVIARHWKASERATGPLAALLLVSQPVFLQKTVEMRPDMLALPFFLGGLALLLRGLRPQSDDARRPRLRWFFAGGLCVGAAIMCTQKMLFVVPGVCVGLALWILGALARRLLAGVAVAAGVTVPAVLTWATFAAQGAGGQFITNNFLLNARWRHMPTNQFVQLWLNSWPVMALAALGALVLLARWRRAQPRDHGGLLLLCTAIGLFLGVLVMPVAHRQYYLMPMPIVCLFAAWALLRLLDKVPARLRLGVVAAAVVGLSILPYWAVRAAYREPNDRQLARLREVFQRTQPTDLVMDGWEGTGVFRPHAFHYYFLHEEAVSMLPQPALDAYLDRLERGEGRPKLIAMDRNLNSLGPRFLDFVRRNYVSRDGFFYYARSSGKD